MTIESLNAELARLEQDVVSLSKQAARDVGDRAKTVREEVVAAEFIATEEAIENVSGVLATLSDIRDIHVEQLKLLIADHRETLKGLTELHSPLELWQLGMQHWERRASHVAEGLTKTVEVVARESRALTTSMVEMWQPFVELVRGDWARR